MLDVCVNVMQQKHTEGRLTCPTKKDLSKGLAFATQLASPLLAFLLLLHLKRIAGKALQCQKHLRHHPQKTTHKQPAQASKQDDTFQMRKVRCVHFFFFFSINTKSTKANNERFVVSAEAGSHVWLHSRCSWRFWSTWTQECGHRSTSSQSTTQRALPARKEMQRHANNMNINRTNANLLS